MLALEDGYRIGQQPITPELIESVIATDIDGLEPKLTRGYNVKALADMLNVKPSEVRSFLHGQLPPGRTQELQDQMLAAGIPSIARLFETNVGSHRCLRALCN